MGAVAVETNPKWHFRCTTVCHSRGFPVFLRQLLGQYRRRRIHQVMDSAKYHKAPEIIQGIEKNLAEIAKLGACSSRVCRDGRRKSDTVVFLEKRNRRVTGG